MKPSERIQQLRAENQTVPFPANGILDPNVRRLLETKRHLCSRIDAIECYLDEVMDLSASAIKHTQSPQKELAEIRKVLRQRDRDSEQEERPLQATLGPREVTLHLLAIEELLERRRNERLAMANYKEEMKPQASQGSPEILTADEAEQKIIRACDAIKELLLEKNRSYGNSVFAAPIVFGQKLGPIERIWVRIEDKLHRLRSGNEYANEDTIRDLAGYLIILGIAERALARTAADRSAENHASQESEANEASDR